MSDDAVFERDWSTLRLSRDAGVVEVTLHRPDARNALNGELMRELTEVARALRLRADIRAVILAGTPEGFSAGADLGGVRSRLAAPTVLEAREAVMAGPDLCRAWEEVEPVTIVAIEGYCIGGACALAVACDFRVLAEGAYLRLPEVPLGMNMSWRSVPRITALVGPARAKRFVLFGEATGAATCLAWGLADEVVPRGEALAAARRWAAKVAALPPLPVRMTKEAVNAAAGALGHATSHMDRDQYLLATRTADFREAWPPSSTSAPAASQATEPLARAAPPLHPRPPTRSASMDELAFIDGCETAARIRQGDLTAGEVVEAAIARAQAVQPQLHFLVTDDFDRARAKAAGPLASGPFAGVPFLIKDLDDYTACPPATAAALGRTRPR
jgi:enoyl-CoA hydratase/carnithine racemase